MPRYLVLARTEYMRPLAYVGDVEAVDDDTARRVAARQHGEGAVEVALVPFAAARWVVGAPA